MKEVFAYEIPEVDYKPLELDELENAWCYVGETEEDTLTRNTKRLVVAIGDSNFKGYFRYLTLGKDNTNTTFTNISIYSFAMRCSDFGEE